MSISYNSLSSHLTMTPDQKGRMRERDVVNVESANQSRRVRHIVIHFTSVEFADSLRLLSDNLRG